MAVTYMLASARRVSLVDSHLIYMYPFVSDFLAYAKHTHAHLRKISMLMPPLPDYVYIMYTLLHHT